MECFDLVFADDFDAAHTPGTTRTEAWDATMAGRIEKWAKKEGIQPSGPGSTVETTAKVRPFLREVFDKLEIRTFLDVPVEI